MPADTEQRDRAYRILTTLRGELWVLFRLGVVGVLVTVPVAGAVTAIPDQQRQQGQVDRTDRECTIIATSFDEEATFPYELTVRGPGSPTDGASR